ncbi:MAG: c-type cytochrome domain-containing protein, partial [Verrucomicrobiota bacterium]
MKLNTTLLALSALPLVAGAEIDFARDIRPILSDNCFACHGPDRNTREADLRLDEREGALANLDGARAIVPGKPEQSELMHRILTDDENDIMPPPKSNKTLTAQEKDLLKQWIEQGAEYAQHWAFIPPERPTPPKVSGTVQ